MLLLSIYGMPFVKSEVCSCCTCSLIIATLPSTRNRILLEKKIKVCLNVINRERVVKTLLGVSSPPVPAYTTKIVNIIKTCDRLFKVRLAECANPAIRTKKDSFLY